MTNSFRHPKGTGTLPTHYSISRYYQTFQVYIDTLDFGYGAVLAQRNTGGKEQLICCASCSLNRAGMSNCRAGSMDLLPFLDRTVSYMALTAHFILWMLHTKQEGSTLLHWQQDKLEKCQYIILHHPGKAQGHVNGLS